MQIRVCQSALGLWLLIVIWSTASEAATNFQFREENVGAINGRINEGVLTIEQHLKDSQLFFTQEKGVVQLIVSNAEVTKLHNDGTATIRVTGEAARGVQTVAVLRLKVDARATEIRAKTIGDKVAITVPHYNEQIILETVGSIFLTTSSDVVGIFETRIEIDAIK